MKLKILDDFPLDNAIAHDEYGYFHNLIDGTLAEVDVVGGPALLPLPFFAFFEGTMKDKLLKAGFKKSVIENKKRLETTIKNLDMQGRGNAYLWTKDWLPYGFPSNVVTFDKNNKKLYWIDQDIGAALFALQSIPILKDLLVNNGAVNKEAIKVYLNTLQLTVSLARAGLILKKVLRGESFSNTQSQRGSKARNTGGFTPEERKARNKEIKSAFEKWKQSENAFCLKYAKKHKLSSSQIRNIINS